MLIVVDEPIAQTQANTAIRHHAGSAYLPSEVRQKQYLRMYQYEIASFVAHALAALATDRFVYLHVFYIEVIRVAPKLFRVTGR